MSVYDSLDQTTDPHIEVLARLVKAAVNGQLSDPLGTEALTNCFGAPLPLSLLGQNVLPAMTIYRQQDRDRDKGDWAHEQTTEFRFDYFAPATPIARLPERWPLLRAVWVATLGVVRQGSHPDVMDGQNLGLGRYVLGSGRCQYAFVPGANNTYPAFRATIEIESSYEPPEEFKGTALADFNLLWTQYDLRPETNTDFEAESETKPNG